MRDEKEFGGVCRIYLADVRPLLNEKVQKKVYDRLPDHRKEKADACRFPKARAASLAAGFLMEYALKDLGLTDCHIAYAPEGAPVVTPDSALLQSVHTGCVSGGAAVQSYDAYGACVHPLHISLSHSGDYAVCAVCDRPVGVDIQQIRPVRMSALKRFFMPEEREEFLNRYVRECDPSTAAGLSDTPPASTQTLPAAAGEIFLWQWAAKESYMKLTGQGMSMGFDQLKIQAISDPALKSDHIQSQGTLAQSPLYICDRQNRHAPAQVLEYRVLEGYCLTVCIGEKGGGHE